jgi:hypothetical protein
LLEQSVTTGFAEPDRLQQDPYLAPIRANPRFTALVGAARRNAERPTLTLPPGIID